MTDKKPKSDHVDWMSGEYYFEYDLPFTLDFADSAILDQLLALNFDVRTPETLHIATLQNLIRDVEGFAVREQITLGTITYHWFNTELIPLGGIIIREKLNKFVKLGLYPPSRISEESELDYQSHIVKSFNISFIMYLELLKLRNPGEGSAVSKPSYAIRWAELMAHMPMELRFDQEQALAELEQLKAEAEQRKAKSEKPVIEERINTAVTEPFQQLTQGTAVPSPLPTAVASQTKPANSGTAVNEQSELIDQETNIVATIREIIKDALDARDTAITTVVMDELEILNEQAASISKEVSEIEKVMLNNLISEISDLTKLREMTGRVEVALQQGTAGHGQLESLNRLEKGIVEVVEERRKQKLPLKDEFIASDLYDKGIYNPLEAKSYTREHINKTRNNLIRRGYKQLTW